MPDNKKGIFWKLFLKTGFPMGKNVSKFIFF